MTAALSDNAKKAIDDWLTQLSKASVHMAKNKTSEEKMREGQAKIHQANNALVEAVKQNPQIAAQVDSLLSNDERKVEYIDAFLKESGIEAKYNKEKDSESTKKRGMSLGAQAALIGGGLAIAGGLAFGLLPGLLIAAAGGVATMGAGYMKGKREDAQAAEHEFGKIENEIGNVAGTDGLRSEIHKIMTSHLTHSIHHQNNNDHKISETFETQLHHPDKQKPQPDVDNTPEPENHLPRPGG